MYPIRNKLKDKTLVSKSPGGWIKMIHDDMSSCVSNLKKKHIKTKVKSEDTIKKQNLILNFCAAQMIENTSA